MRRPELVTLDMTAIRDAVEEGRAQHAEGLTLLALAERGEVELGVPPQGALADLHGQFGGDLAQQIRALLTRPGVVELPQIARPSDVTFPSVTLWPGHLPWQHRAETSRPKAERSTASGAGVTRRRAC
jgi:hypothetical protein